jgi:hypothetical protein
MSDTLDLSGFSSFVLRAVLAVLILPRFPG